VTWERERHRLSVVWFGKGPDDLSPEQHKRFVAFLALEIMEPTPRLF
jgi:hypothetical protein